MYFMVWLYTLFFFLKQKTAYELRISAWSSDVCSSDLLEHRARAIGAEHPERAGQRAERQRLEPAPLARRDIAERPGGGEAAVLTRIDAGHRHAAAIGIVHRQPPTRVLPHPDRAGAEEIGRAEGRERVC